MANSVTQRNNSVAENSFYPNWRFTDNFPQPPITAASSGTNMQINIGDVWKTVSGLQINVGDSWKTVTKVQINIGDTWKTIFG